MRHNRLMVAACLSFAAACHRYASWDTISCASEPMPPLRYSDAPTAPGVVAGRLVYPRDTSIAMVGARVRLVNESGERSVLADSVGRFEFPDVSPGAYALVVQRIGMIRRQDSVRVAQGAGVTVTAAMLVQCMTAADAEIRYSQTLMGVVVK